MRKSIFWTVVTIFIVGWILVLSGCSDNPQATDNKSIEVIDNSKLSQYYTLSFTIKQKYNILRESSVGRDNSVYIEILDTTTTFYDLESWTDVYFSTLPEQWGDYSTTGWLIECDANWGENQNPSAIYWNIGLAGWWHEYNISFIDYGDHKFSIIITSMFPDSRYYGQFGVLEIN